MTTPILLAARCVGGPSYVILELPAERAQFILFAAQGAVAALEGAIRAWGEALQAPDRVHFGLALKAWCAGGYRDADGTEPLLGREGILRGWGLIDELPPDATPGKPELWFRSGVEPRFQVLLDDEVVTEDVVLSQFLVEARARGAR